MDATTPLPHAALRALTTLPRMHANAPTPTIPTTGPLQHAEETAVIEEKHDRIKDCEK